MSIDNNNILTPSFLLVGPRDSAISPSVSASHIISGPVSAGGSRGRRSRPQQSVLANAFEGAWKQGNLTAEVYYTPCVCVCVCVFVFVRMCL